jgi:hypothetical protein
MAGMLLIRQTFVKRSPKRKAAKRKGAEGGGMFSKGSGLDLTEGISIYFTPEGTEDARRFNRRNPSG